MPTLRQRILVFLAVFLLCASSTTRAHAALAKAEVDRDRLGLEQTLLLTVTVTGAGANVDVSVIEDFTVLARQSASQISIINGQSTYTTELQYLLGPNRIGELTIPALPVEVNGESITTEPITVTVQEDAVKDSGGKDDPDLLITLQAGVSDTTPYLGQELTYTLSIITNNVNILGRGLEEPKFEGFSAIKLDNVRQYRSTLDGQDVLVFELTWLLRALGEGAKVIEPALFYYEVPAPHLSMHSAITETRTARSKPLDVEVSPLPPYEGERSFSGLVGDFDITADLERQTMAAGESATLVVTVSGRGNLDGLGEPEFTGPEKCKVYADKPVEELSASAEGTTGHKVFRYALVPLEQGEMRIEAFSLTWFDPDQGKYVTKQTDPIVVEVSKGAEMAATPEPGQEAATAEAADKTEVELKHRDILPLKNGLDSLESKGPLDLWLLLALLLVPVALYGLVLVAAGLAGRDKGPGREMARRAAQALKQAAQTLESDPDQCLAHCSRALVAAVFAAAGDQGEALTYEEAAALLKGCSGQKGRSTITEQDPEAVPGLMRDLDALRYGGGKQDTEAVRAVFDTVRKTVRRLCP